MPIATTPQAACCTGSFPVTHPPVEARCIPVRPPQPTAAQLLASHQPCTFAVSQYRSTIVALRGAI